ncbi:MAG: MFS transporter, partial [Verrucomicrobia bacterium]|nr:MFS transporter [Verrucomicrobiota bacterium]
MITAIYLAGLLQGISLVAFPAASTIFTSPHQFGFSVAAYGSLFIPQALLSITFAALNPKICRSLGSKCTLFLGLFANLLAMALLALSSLYMGEPTTSYTILLIATGCLGIGFGLTVPVLNLLVALLYPKKVDSLVLVLNALLGVGTALAPIFFALFTALGFWWELPLLLVVALL